jgi:hypothetical protein
MSGGLGAIPDDCTIFVPKGTLSAYQTADGWSNYADYMRENGSTGIYGVVWDGSETTKFTRTDDAAGFTDPVPYVAGAETYGSPFDTIRPWSRMARVTDDEAGELVAIPKYYYRWTLGEDKSLALQISNEPHEGFFTSPAHADRGDGKGERNVVYIGRYHSAEGYKSTTGESPVTTITRSAAREGIHALGTTVWQSDWAMRLTIQMLYLVEYANWNSQATIGYGCGNGSSAEAVGASDTMPYHTGTMQADRATAGVGVQYRYIEGLWDDVFDWVDGCYYFGGDNQGVLQLMGADNAANLEDDGSTDDTDDEPTSGMKVIMNPAEFSDTEGGVYIGEPTGGLPQAMSVVESAGVQWVYPSESDEMTSSYDTYVSDYLYFNSGFPCLGAGGSYDPGDGCGLFCVGCDGSASAGDGIGSRLQKLP